MDITAWSALSSIDTSDNRDMDNECYRLSGYFNTKISYAPSHSIFLILEQTLRYKDLYKILYKDRIWWAWVFSWQKVVKLTEESV